MIYSGDCSEWLESRLGFEPEDGECFYVMGDRGIKGAVVFHDYDSEDVELTAAGDTGWLTRRLIRFIGWFVFEYIRCMRCTMRIAVGNKRMVDLAHRLGFTLEGRMRKARNGEDVLIFGMLREENPWQRKKLQNSPR